MYMFILCIDDIHNNDFSVCLPYAVVLPCVVAVCWMHASESREHCKGHCSFI